MELQKTFTKLFAVNTTDLSAVQNQLTIQLQQIGLDTSMIAQYTEQVAALKAVLVSSPDTAQSAAIATEIGKYIKSADSIISSQPGLVHFQNDSDILLDSQFDEFRVFYKFIVSNSELLKQNPGNAVLYFRTEKVSASGARFLILISEASQKAKVKKALSSEFKMTI
jgi:hypothetical protein